VFNKKIKKGVQQRSKFTSLKPVASTISIEDLRIFSELDHVIRVKENITEKECQEKYIQPLTDMLAPLCLGVAMSFGIPSSNTDGDEPFYLFSIKSSIVGSLCTSAILNCLDLSNLPDGTIVMLNKISTYGCQPSYLRGAVMNSNCNIYEIMNDAVLAEHQITKEETECTVTANLPSSFAVTLEEVQKMFDEVYARCTQAQKRELCDRINENKAYKRRTDLGLTSHTERDANNFSVEIPNVKVV
jgi:hypothetical protein